MKISASQMAGAAANRQASVRPPAQSSAAVTGAPVVQPSSADKLDLSKGAQPEAAPSTQGQTTSERVAALSDKVHSRLENLAQSLDPRSDVDISAIQAQFAQNIERLQDGIESGAFDDKQIATGVQNTLSLLTGGVREALGLDDAPRMSEARVTESSAAGDAQAAAPARASGLSPADRISALEDKVNDRISGMLSGLEGASASEVKELQMQFNEHVGRVQAGLADGSLSIEQVSDGMRNTMSMLADGLRDATAEQSKLRAADGAVDGAGASHDAQQARFSEFAEKVAERLANLNMDGAEARMVSDVASTFESNMERLETAFFEKGSIDRDQFGTLFESMLGQLQKDLASVMKPETQGVKLYGADMGVDALKAGASSFDVSI